MHTFIKIGEMARMFGLNIRTLRYYDEIGLMKPAYTDPDTGYRYYCIEQFQQLNTIRYFRAQGMSLEAIQAALEQRSPEKIRDILQERQAAVDQQIRELQNVKIRLENRIRHIADVMDTSLLDTLCVEELPARPAVEIKLRLRVGEDYEIHLRSLEQRSGIMPSYFVGKVGLRVSLENILSGQLKHYESLLCLVEPGEADDSPHTQLPAGLWASWRFRGDHMDSPAQYKVLLEALKQRRLRPVGSAAEFALMDGGLTEDPKEYTTEIQIPVVKI